MIWWSSASASTIAAAVSNFRAKRRRPFQLLPAMQLSFSTVLNHHTTPGRRDKIRDKMRNKKNSTCHQLMDLCGDFSLHSHGQLANHPPIPATLYTLNWTYLWKVALWHIDQVSLWQQQQERLRRQMAVIFLRGFIFPLILLYSNTNLTHFSFISSIAHVGNFSHFKQINFFSLWKYYLSNSH